MFFELLFPMTSFSYSLLFFLLLTCSFSYAQKKTLQATSIAESITIDGKPNEAIWKSTPIATDFVMFDPDNGKPISPDKKTEVQVLYDNNAIYIMALLYDNEPNKILKEITERDDFGTSDHFGVYINGFNDGQQDFRFFVSAAGVQMDCVATAAGEDYSWNAIWDSKAVLTDFGWAVEMKIPYAALRFSNSEKQTWGLNFYRELRRDRQKYTWNHIDTKIGATLTQNGILEGIHDIKTPTRLFFIPYSSYYYTHNETGSQNKFKAGLDIKYGINDSFTLDAILVPDFGQTKFDNVVLNLSPYEQQFNENRPFFTEGTDLFSKGGLLYSRRIGGGPSTYPSTATNETVEEFPNTVDLLNAVKISGRTKGGLGIGVLNAITKKTHATIRDNDTDETRRVVVEPLANYNLVVLDQRFNQNSSVSLVNTNVSRNGSFRDANVTALVWDLNTLANTYKLYGDFKYSHINDIEDTNGFKTALNFQKTSGKHRYDLVAKYISGEYDINDMGISFQNNYHSFYANYNYRIINPTKYFNSFRVNVATSEEIQNTTGKLQDFYVSVTTNGTTRKNDYMQYGLQINPLETFDFYQPRRLGRYSYNPRAILSWFTFSSNYNKAFALDLTPSINIQDEKNRIGYGAYVSPRFRFNDKLLLVAAFDYYQQTNDRGYADETAETIFFGERDRKTINSELSGRYSLNNKMTVNLTARYYWSFSENHDVFTLNNDGYLTYLTNDPETLALYNQNLNIWNFDLSYSWWFAPASQLSVLYRNNALDFRNEIDRKFTNNVDNLFKNNINTVFSVSVRYFIDYNSLKK